MSLGCPSWILLAVAANLAACGGDGDQVFIIESSEGMGAHSFSGRVELPEGTPSGRAIQIQVQRLSSPGYFIIEVPGQTSGADGFGFEFIKASDGEYRVSARVDINESGMFDTGDLDGFFDGTVEAPVQDRDLAAVITIAGASIDGIDFGIGPSP